MPKTNTKSYNTTVGATAKPYLLPGIAQILLYLLLSILLLLALNARNIWRYFSDTVVISQSQLEPSSSWISRTWDSVLHGIWLQILFWILVGCLVYIFIWFLSNIIANIRNDIIADDYKHPAFYSHYKFWESVLARKVFFGVSLTLLIIYFFFFARMTKLLAQLCYSAFSNFSWTSSLQSTVGAIISCAFLIYILILLLHITANAWRVTFKDL